MAPEPPLENSGNLEEDSEIPERLDESVVSRTEMVHLKALAANRKRKRLVFFNSENGVKLRLAVRGHEQRQQVKVKYCVLCGNNTGAWRGHRSSFKCSHCDVHLCVRTYPGLRKSCWDVFHSCKTLHARVTARPESIAVSNPTQENRHSSQHAGPQSSQNGTVEDSGEQLNSQNRSSQQGVKELRQSARRQRSEPSTPTRKQRRTR